MTEQVQERPAAVTVIGWSSIVLAVLLFLSGLMGVASGALMQTAPPDAANLPPGFEEMSERMSDMLQYTIPLSFLQLGIAVVMVVGSILLLRLRETGRLMLEALNWFGLVFTIAVSAWFIPMWSRTMAEVAQKMPNQPGGGAVVSGPVFMTTLGIVQVAIIIVIIWVLRSKTVRGAMHS